MIKLSWRRNTFKHIVCRLLPLVVGTSALAAEQPQPRVQRIVGVTAEHGIVALSGNELSVFSAANIGVQDATTLDWDLVKKRSGAFSIRVEGTRWRELTRHLSIPTGHGFAFCDPFNQVDLRLWDKKLSSALPAGAKLKSFFNVRSDTYVVVYSVSKDAVVYDVRVGIVVSRTPEDYSLIREEMATDAGNFCGLQQGKGGVFFVFADEPSGSSDFSAVYVFAVVDKDHGER